MLILAPKPVSFGHLIETTIDRLREILTLFSIHLMHEVRSKSAKTVVFMHVFLRSLLNEVYVTSIEEQ